MTEERQAPLGAPGCFSPQDSCAGAEEGQQDWLLGDSWPEAPGDGVCVCVRVCVSETVFSCTFCPHTPPSHLLSTSGCCPGHRGWKRGTGDTAIQPND